MSLYDEAILIQKPSGYKAEKLYNVMPSPEVTEQSSIEFDGVDDELITDGDSVAQPTTYSFWCKSTETSSNGGVFGHGGYSIGAFHFAYDNTQPLLYLGGGYYRYWAANSAQDDGEWHHWVVYVDTNDITNSKLYVDGVLQSVDSTGSSGSSNAYTEGLTIGGDKQSSGNYFNGSISDFAVFSSELSAADVTEIYNYGSPNDLLLPASYGTDISQSSTKSVEFDGVDDYAATTSSFQSAFRDSFTISFWVKCDDGQPSAEISILGTRNSTSEDWVHCNQQTDGDITFYYKSNNNAAEARTSSVVFGDGNTEWFYIALVADNTAEQLKIYVNGVSIAVSGGGLSSVTMSDWTSSDDLFLGARNNNGSAEKFFSGSIDNVGIYDKALTQAEITRQYNGGQPIDLSTDATSDSLVAYYKMGDGTLDQYPLIADQTDATLGSEEMVNGDLTDNPFATPSYTNGWSDSSIGTSVAVWNSGNNTIELVGDGSGSNRGNATARISCIANKTYKLDYNELTTPANAAIRVNSTGSWSDSSTAYFDVENYTAPFYFTSNVTGYVYIVFSVYDAVQWEIGSVSVKEVQGNPAAMTNMSSSDITTDVALSVVNDLESYYQMGDGILDDYPLIADQTNATLGSEEVTNGDFATDSDWTKTQATISGGEVRIITTDGSYAAIDQSNVFEVGKAYSYSIDVKSISGTMQLRGGLGTVIDITTSGVKTGNIVPTSTGIEIKRKSSAGALDVTIDNVSVKQIQGNPAAMTNMSSDDIVAWTPNIETDFDVARSSWTTRRNASGYIEQVAPNVPRLNYDSGDSCPYLLTEAAGTNLITYPISFGNSYWTKSGASIEGDASTAVNNILGTGDSFDFQGGTLGSWVNYRTGIASIDATSKLGSVYSMKINPNNTSYDGAIINTGVTISPNTSYLITFDYLINSSDWRFMISYNGNMPSSDSAYPATVIPNSNGVGGSVSIYFTSENASAYTAFISINSFSATTDIGYFDNVSVKEVQGFEAPKEIPVANGAELVTNGDFATDSDWTKETGWTITGNKAVGTATTGSLYQALAEVIQGNTYKVEYTVSDYTGGTLFTLLKGTSGATISSNGTFVEYLTAGVGNILEFNALTSFTAKIDNVSVKEVTSYSGGGFEKEAYKLVEDTNSGTHYINSTNVTTTATNEYTGSIYAKQAGRTWIKVDCANGGNAYFDLANGVVGTELNASGTIVAMADGWYRCNVIFTALSTNSAMYVNLADADGSTSYTGDGTSGLYIAYAQLEESSYASSLMLPTTEGSTTSRVGDAITNAGNQSLFSSVINSGVLYIEASSTGTNNNFVSLGQGNTSNKIQITFNNNNISLYAQGQNGTEIGQDFTTTTTDTHKVAIRWNGTSVITYMDGVPNTDGEESMSLPFTNFDRFRFDSYNGAVPFIGKTNAVAVFNYLSDAEMVTLTT